MHGRFTQKKAAIIVSLMICFVVLSSVWFVFAEPMGLVTDDFLARESLRLTSNMVALAENQDYLVLQRYLGYEHYASEIAENDFSIPSNIIIGEVSNEAVVKAYSEGSGVDLPSDLPSIVMEKISRNAFLSIPLSMYINLDDYMIRHGISISLSETEAYPVSIDSFGETIVLLDYENSSFASIVMFYQSGSNVITGVSAFVPSNAVHVIETYFTGMRVYTSDELIALLGK